MLVKNLISIYVSFFLKRYNFKNDLEITKNRNKILKQKLIFFLYFDFEKENITIRSKKKKKRRKIVFCSLFFIVEFKGKEDHFFSLRKKRESLGAEEL